MYLCLGAMKWVRILGVFHGCDEGHEGDVTNGSSRPAYLGKYVISLAHAVVKIVGYLYAQVLQDGVRKRGVFYRCDRGHGEDSNN